MPGARHPRSMCTMDGDQVWTYRALRERMTRREIERRLRRGGISRVRRGVYAGAHACAAVITAAAHGGALGCESAARHLGLWVLGDPELHVWMHSDRHQYPHDEETRLRLRPFGWTVRTQAPIVGTGRVDLLIDGWLIIETDGQGNHDGPSHRHKDLVRDANAAFWGHPTLRFDYAMVVHDWDLVERAIVATIRRRDRPPASARRA